MDVVDLFVADSSVKAVERQMQVYILAPYLFSSKLNINYVFATWRIFWPTDLHKHRIS